MKHCFLIAILFPTFLFSQAWERTYGGEYDDAGHSVQQTTDGGYIIAGWTRSFGNGFTDVYLIKTDSNGDTIWTKTIGGIIDDYGFSVQQTNDNGFIIAGSSKLTPQSKPDMYLIKTDYIGVTTWTKKYGGMYDEAGYSVQQTTDGGYIVTGWTGLFSSGTYDVYLVKTDNNGDTLWTKTFGGEDNDSGRSVQQTTDGGYIITGYTASFGSGESDVYLIKTDSNGDTLWTKTIGGDSYDHGYSVKQTTDSGYIISGWTESFGNGGRDIFFLKTDSNGDTTWTKTYGGDNWEEGYSVQQTTDGGYIITGYTGSFGNSESNVYLIKSDNDGNTLWTRTFGGGDYDGGTSVQQTTDSGFIIAGYTGSFGNGEIDVYLIKTDENGVITFTTEIPVPNPNRKLVKVVDLSGRVITKPLKNQPYIEIYNDGTTQKKMKLK